MGGEGVTDKERECLEALRSARIMVPKWRGWLTPMFVGGRDASHHSATLGRLVARGLVERKVRGGWLRASYLYRITKSGLAALQVRP
jgi:hypothetical protein